jgi:hypothetical protein
LKGSLIPLLERLDAGDSGYIFKSYDIRSSTFMFESSPHNPGSLSFEPLASADIDMTIVYWRKKVIVRPEMVRSIEIHHVDKYEMNTTKSVRLCSLEKAFVLHLRSVKDFHFGSSTNTKFKRTTMIALMAKEMTRNWQKRLTETKMDYDRLRETTQEDRLKFAKDMDGCIAPLFKMKRRACETGRRCDFIAKNLSSEWRMPVLRWIEI